MGYRYREISFVRVWSMAALCCIAALSMAGCKSGQQDRRNGAPLETVKLCRATTMLLLPAVAEKKGFFAAEGLAVDAKDFTVGKDALEAMLNGQCDLATAAEPPVIDAALVRNDFRIVSSLQRSDNHSRIVARADLGIRGPADLAGKKIGVVKGTAPHYFLDLFLKQHGIARDKAAFSFMKADDLLDALKKGDVAAIAITNKVVLKARQELQEKAIVLESPGLCKNYFMLLASSRILQGRPAATGRFMRALARAEEYIRTDPSGARAIARSHPNITPYEIDHLWDNYEHRLMLDTSLLMGLEETARWSQSLSPGKQRDIPNLIQFIDRGPLEAARPSAVQLN